VFVESTFVRQVAEIGAGLCEPVVEVGDLKPRRNYPDVRDIVRGYAVLLGRGEPGEVYNLRSGRSWFIQHVLDFLWRNPR
jgi:GDP-4-dehydro-6-deoxy-D-mannose reductase